MKTPEMTRTPTKQEINALHKGIQDYIGKLRNDKIEAEKQLTEALAEIERLRKLMVEIIELRTAECYRNQLLHDPVFKIAKTAERGEV